MFPIPCVFSTSFGVIPLDFHQGLWHQSHRLTEKVMSSASTVTVCILYHFQSVARSCGISGSAEFWPAAENPPKKIAAAENDAEF